MIHDFIHAVRLLKKSPGFSLTAVRQGMNLVFMGIMIGLAGTLALTGLMKSLLFGVTATDPLTFVLVTLVLLFIAVLACWIPARRATKVDPIVALDP